MKNAVQTSILFLLAALLINACAAAQPTATATPEKHTFELLIFEHIEGVKDDWYDDPQQSQKALKAAKKQDALFIIGIDQIEAYNWNLQTITLTKNATEQLMQTLDGKKTASTQPEDEELKKFKEMMLKVNPAYFLEMDLYVHPFVVNVDDEFKYGGIFLDAMSQRPANFPVIRVINTEKETTFAFLPKHLLFTMTDPIGDDGELGKPTVDPIAQGDIEQLDVFPTVSARQAGSETATIFRKIIRDETIKRIFEEAGKLKLK